MKPKKLGKKLQLNKKTVANLNLDEVKKVYGGNAPPTDLYSNCPHCPVP